MQSFHVQTNTLPTSAQCARPLRPALSLLTCAHRSLPLLPSAPVRRHGRYRSRPSAVAAPRACSLRLNKQSSGIGMKPKKFEFKVTSSMAEIATEKGEGKGKVHVFDSEEILAASLAKYTADLSEKFARERGAFTVVVSGGSLVKSLRKLVEAPYIDLVEWSRWHVFWVDERVVPKDHQDSNYKLAYDAFLSKVPIPSGNVYSINDALSAEGAADDYETCLKHLIKTSTINLSHSTGFPKFDLVLLGMGPDGHVASLFPRHPLLQAKNEQWVAFIEDSPKPPPQRITFTFPVINSSANIALVVTGDGKADVVNVVMGNNGQNLELLPVQMVSPEGELTWFLDKGAASKL